MDNPEDNPERKWYHFDIEGTPCARDSLIYGVYGGGLGGIAYFFKSGLVKRSCDAAVGVFCITTLVYWGVCRYQRAKIQAELKRTVSVLNEKSNNINDNNGSTISKA